MQFFYTVLLNSFGSVNIWCSSKAALVLCMISCKCWDHSKPGKYLLSYSGIYYKIKKMVKRLETASVWVII